MTISLTVHIQCRYFADAHKDNKHKRPLIKQFTDGYTADVVPRLLRITYCSCQTLPVNFYPSKAAPRAASGGAKSCTKLKPHQRVFSLFFFFSGCEASRAAFTALLRRSDVSNQAQPTATLYFHVQEPFLSLPHSQCQAGGTAVYYQLIADHND